MPSRLHLPRAQEAVIPTDKLVGCALDPEHPRGRHKARVFAAALGIRQADWRYLHDQLRHAVVDAEVRGTRITAHGVLYDLVVLIDDVLRESCVMASERHSALDVVALLSDSGRWPAGTVGTVIEVDDHSALVEITDERGRALDFLSLPHDALTSSGDGVSRAAS